MFKLKAVTINRKSTKCVSNGKRLTINHKPFTKGQVVMEFTFCMIILFLMIYGLLQIFQWTGLDLADRRKAHDALITTDLSGGYFYETDGPLRQIDPYFYRPRPMNAVWSDY